MHEIFENFLYSLIYILRPPKKSELISKTLKARAVRYAIVQWFSELTHSSSEASNLTIYLNELGQFSNFWANSFSLV